MTTGSVSFVVRVPQLFTDAPAIGNVFEPRLQRPLANLGVSGFSVVTAAPTRPLRTDSASMCCPSREVGLEVGPVRLVQIDLVVLATVGERDALDCAVVRLGAVPAA